MKTKILLLNVMLIFSIAVIADNYGNIGKIINVPRDYPTIQAAIDAATAHDMVLVAEGTYYENIRFKGKPITVASEYIIDGSALHISRTIIKGLSAHNSPMAATVLFIDGEDTTSVLNGFTITGGHGVLYNTYQRRCGGGIYVLNSGAKIINNIITGNKVEGVKAGGAGICCVMDDAEEYWTVIDGNLIKNNNSLSNGHLACGGGISIMINSIIKNNLIEFNTCVNTVGQAHGGGIEIEKMPGTSIVSTIENNTIRNNLVEGVNGTAGGGIASYNATLSILKNIIKDNQINTSNVSKGAGVFVYKSSDILKIQNNRFENNIAYGDYPFGGALMILQCEITELTNNQFYKNSTIATEKGNGGAVWITQSKDMLIIADNVFRDNNAGHMSYGGAVGIYSTTCDIVHFDKNRLLDNTAREGAGLWTFNTFNINLCNNVFIRNIASYLGGAIKHSEYAGVNLDYPLFDDEEIAVSNLRDDIRPVISNNNFIQNKAFKGGAICSDIELNTPVIFNSIFCNNTAMVGKDLSNLSDNPLAVFNCIINAEGITCPWTGLDNMFCDPLLDGDCSHLCWGSSCANAGIEALYYDDIWYNCAEYDVDGDERPYASTKPDIGVDETEVLFVDVPYFSNNKYDLNIYPNPIMNYATVEFELTQNAHVNLFIFNTAGEIVETILSSVLIEGVHRLEWNAENLSSGIYYFKLDMGNQTQIKKIVVMK